MKQNLTLIFLLFFISNYAQEKLVVDYIFNYKYDLTKSSDARTLAIYKASNKNTGEYQLITTKEESIFNSIEKINNSQNVFDVEPYSVPSANLYNNILENYTLDPINFKGKNFIVKDTVTKYNWLLEREYDKILGYDVKKAVAKRFNITYEAWFAPSLPYKTGPGNIFGLPGLILKLKIILDQDDGVHQHIYTATKVDLNDKAKIIKPTKGELMMVDDFTVYFNKILRIEAEIENNKVETKID
ncbi:GLPGLI family protein [Faecalibacter macacae]|uniref:GLPGLI family protein n=1 Tax=Faecalibacter macacae TaxID=1859289 RepID=A0A3L9M6W0_9FLAO|nr:GLPGLI family protein [Faecalibacter macacae]RLZ08765.1 GLPGLI family protein [Faecalibacter macacae]